MKANKLLMLAALVCAGATTPAFAQHVTPANQSFTLSGAATLAKPAGGPALNCTLTFAGTTTTGPDVGGDKATGGSLDTGTNTGAGCTNLVVSPSAFSITGTVSSSEWSGVMSRVTVVNTATSTTLCDQANVPFTIDDTGYVHMDTDLTPPPGDPYTCHVTADLYTDNGVVGTN